MCTHLWSVVVKKEQGQIEKLLLYLFIYKQTNLWSWNMDYNEKRQISWPLNNWFNGHGVTVFDWSANWPEVNPIEKSMDFCQKKEDRHQTQQCRRLQGSYQSSATSHWYRNSCESRQDFPQNKLKSVSGWRAIGFYPGAVITATQSQTSKRQTDVWRKKKSMWLLPQNIRLSQWTGGKTSKKQ